MKNLSLLILTLLFSTTLIFAQEDSKLKNEKKETITKISTVKGADEKTTITKTVKKEGQLIKIKDTGEENQNEEYSTKKQEYTTETKEVKINKDNEDNEDAKKEYKKKQDKEQQENIEKYKKEQIEKYEKMKKEAEKKKKDSKKGN